MVARSYLNTRNCGFRPSYVVIDPVFFIFYLKMYSFFKQKNRKLLKNTRFFGEKLPNIFPQFWQCFDKKKQNLNFCYFFQKNYGKIKNFVSFWGQINHFQVRKKAENEPFLAWKAPQIFFSQNWGLQLKKNAPKNQQFFLKKIQKSTIFHSQKPSKINHFGPENPRKSTILFGDKNYLKAGLLNKLKAKNRFFGLFLDFFVKNERFLMIFRAKKFENCAKTPDFLTKKSPLNIENFFSYIANFHKNLVIFREKCDFMLKNLVFLSNFQFFCAKNH